MFNHCDVDSFLAAVPNLDAVWFQLCFDVFLRTIFTLFVSSPWPFRARTTNRNVWLVPNSQSNYSVDTCKGSTEFNCGTRAPNATSTFAITDTLTLCVLTSRRRVSQSVFTSIDISSARAIFQFHLPTFHLPIEFNLMLLLQQTIVLLTHFREILLFL